MNFKNIISNFTIENIKRGGFLSYVILSSYASWLNYKITSFLYYSIPDNIYNIIPFKFDDNIHIVSAIDNNNNIVTHKLEFFSKFNKRINYMFKHGYVDIFDFIRRIKGTCLFIIYWIDKTCTNLENNEKIDGEVIIKELYCAYVNIKKYEINIKKIDTDLRMVDNWKQMMGEFSFYNDYPEREVDSDDDDELRELMTNFIN